MRHQGFVACVALVVMLVMAAPAGAHSAEIARADTDSNWMIGSFAGSVRVDACEGVPCTWVPLATVQPAGPDYACRGDEPFDSDPNTLIIWSGGVQEAPGAVPFDVRDTPILPGVHGQRLCVSVLELGRRPDPVCVATAPILGIDPATCRAAKNDKAMVVAERFVSEAQESTPATDAPDPAPGAAPRPVVPTTTSPGPAPLPRSAAAAYTRRALREAAGRSWLRRTNSSVRCARETNDILVCKARWKYKKKPRVRRLLVTRRPDGKVTTTFLRPTA